VKNRQRGGGEIRRLFKSQADGERGITSPESDGKGGFVEKGGGQKLSTTQGTKGCDGHSRKGEEKGEGEGTASSVARKKTTNLYESRASNGGEGRKKNLSPKNKKNC